MSCNVVGSIVCVGWIEVVEDVEVMFKLTEVVEVIEEMDEDVTRVETEDVSFAWTVAVE